jgi:hypothetical protein
MNHPEGAGLQRADRVDFDLNARACRNSSDSGFQSWFFCDSLVEPAMGVRDGQATSCGVTQSRDCVCRGGAWASRGGTALSGVAALCERHGDPQARERRTCAEGPGQSCRGQAGTVQRLAAGAAGGQGGPDAGRDRGRTGRRAWPVGASRLGRKMAAPAWPQP